MTNMTNIEDKKNTFAVMPAVDIYESKEDYTLKLDMPAIKKENISITLNDGKLEVEGNSENIFPNDNLKYGEFKLGKYYRAFTVGADVDPARIEAKSENGVLTIELKKREESKPKKIEVIAS